MATFRGLIKDCVVCSAQFKVPRSLERVQTCSRECGYKARVVANKKEPVRMSCAHCSTTFASVPCQADRRVYCSRACREASPAIRHVRAAVNLADRNPNWKGGVSVHAVSASGKAYRRRPAHIETERVARRRAQKLQATPAWADLQAMRAIYAEAKRLTAATGIEHHVDHQVPLISPDVCGLHNHHNLQILTAQANLSKGNRFHTTSL